MKQQLSHILSLYRLPYQSPANSTFLPEQTSHQQPANSTFSLRTNQHQPSATGQTNGPKVFFCFTQGKKINCFHNENLTMHMVRRNGRPKLATPR
jgi:hypothetical protein